MLLSVTALGSWKYCCNAVHLRARNEKTQKVVEEANKFSLFNKGACGEDAISETAISGLCLSEVVGCLRSD